MLKAAELLLQRRAGQRGQIASALVRRSISTSYYALFHFLSELTTAKVVGVGGNLRVRRRVLARTITHRGLRLALDKVRGQEIHSSVRQFFTCAGVELRAAPAFARNMATAFLDAQAKRESADYDLNETFSETEARLLLGRVRRALHGWDRAVTSADKEFKHALAVLILLRGQLRQDQLA